MQHSKYRRMSGFTLVEVMVVLVILGLLAGIVVPNILDQVDKGKAERVKADFSSISTALKMYRLENDSYPTTEQGLQALIEKPTLPPEPRHWKKGGYLPQLPVDPWDRDYYYQSPGEQGEFDIYTLGRDGVPGGEGVDADIGNWKEENQ